MEDKKNTLIVYLDDDDTKKQAWCDILEETNSYVTFKYRDEQITIPRARILKIKRKVSDGP